MVKKEYVVISGIVVLLVSVVLFLHFSNAEEEEVIVDLFQSDFQSVSSESDNLVDSNETLIMIDIKGAITRPGVYELKQGDRVYQAIDLAGGMLAEADEQQLNLALLLQDEMVIYVPIQGEEGHIVQDMTMVSSDQDGKISINQAGASDLERLPGIGPSKAEAIISYRDEHGPFKEINDLLKVAGIGPKSVEKLEEHLIFN